MLKTIEREQIGTEKALSLENGIEAQSPLLTERVYCDRHGVVKSYNGHCETCFDAGYRDWDATRVAKLLIPDWTGIETDGRQVIVSPVRDALEAIQAIGQYKNSDAIVLIVWDTLVTALDHDKIGPNWTLGGEI